MIYADILRRLQKATPEELAQEVLICMYRDEYAPVGYLIKHIAEETPAVLPNGTVVTDRLDDGHLYLTLKYPLM